MGPFGHCGHCSCSKTPSLLPPIWRFRDSSSEPLWTLLNMKPYKREPPFSIVLVNPEIPGNTGSIGRTCVALNIPLVLIHPLGFDLQEKSVRRAGLDYWEHLELHQYESFEEFIENEQPKALSFYSKSAPHLFYHNEYEKGCTLVFGSETQGLPPSLLKRYGHLFFSLPMYSPKVRSLNLANAATAVAYEALRQISYTDVSRSNDLNKTSMPSHSLTG